ncbi:hypothetical protein JTE90_020552 [Oedothorax gibbosus]|uniref:Uncharacterized protein n=1 Tax=Oedothorax gibbosus TaxID=931172 RepID=A0AAV6VYK6_9ARAC|nr:hypothetical protein JTE90_020552 [Oedothorax gibbosus]
MESISCLVIADAPPPNIGVERSCYPRFGNWPLMVQIVVQFQLTEFLESEKLRWEMLENALRWRNLDSGGASQTCQDIYAYSNHPHHLVLAFLL